MITLEKNHAIWRSKVNNLADYIEADSERSRILLELIEACGLGSPSILEIGCNVGRNLEYLRRAGYAKLTGIEISEPAIDMMKEQYPLLHKQATIHNNAVEDVITEFPANGFDVVFSMAVLQHIHPDGEWVFEHIARIAKHALITIENEAAPGHRKIPGLWTQRNYREIFEGYGMRQIAQRSMGAVCANNEDMAPYTARIFRSEQC